MDRMQEIRNSIEILKRRREDEVAQLPTPELQSNADWYFVNLIDDLQTELRFLENERAENTSETQGV